MSHETARYEKTIFLQIFTAMGMFYSFNRVFTSCNGSFFRCFMINLFVIVLMCNCKHTDTNDIINIKIDVSERSKVDLSEISDQVIAVPLETNENCLLAKENIRRIEYYEGVYYLEDYFYVYAFNTSGNFIRRFGKRGPGPDEYINKMSFCLNRLTRHVCLFTTDKRVMVYDLEGNLIKYFSNVNPGIPFFSNNHFYIRHFTFLKALVKNNVA